MTDISNWPELIHKAETPNPWNEPTREFVEVLRPAYYMLPFNEYLLGNLLDILVNSEDTGDWYFEIADIVIVTMRKYSIRELQGNNGEVFTPDNLMDKLVEHRGRKEAS